MVRKFLELIRENRRNQKEILRYSKEIYWASIYRDSIKGKDWLENMPLNVGRWGCDYAFFYLMNRILSDFSPKLILELGLGESSKFISSFLNRELPDSQHFVLEQDENWKELYLKNNQMFSCSEIIHS